MTGAAGLRDSTQIVLPVEALEGLRGDLDRQFVLTVVENDGRARLVGSPVEIKRASDWLTRQGVFVD
jgi:hypothetical protein